MTAGLRTGSRITKDWSQSEHLLADQVDLLTRLVWLNYFTVQGIVQKASRYLKKPPEMLPRPKEQAKKAEPKRFATIDELRQVMRVI